MLRTYGPWERARGHTPSSFVIGELEALLKTETDKDAIAMFDTLHSAVRTAVLLLRGEELEHGNIRKTERYRLAKALKMTMERMARAPRYPEQALHLEDLKMEQWQLEEGGTQRRQSVVLLRAAYTRELNALLSRRADDRGDAHREPEGHHGAGA